jgi:hypothetical protein
MSSSDRILPHFGECLRRVLSIGICQGTAFQQILWASWVEASEAQVPPVPPVPGCSQSQFTEFTEFTEFTVRVPQRNRSASFQSFHSFFSFTSFSSDSFDSFDSFLSLGLLGLRLTKWLDIRWMKFHEIQRNIEIQPWKSNAHAVCVFSCYLSKEQLADGASGLLWRLWNLPLSHQTPHCQHSKNCICESSVNHLWIICSVASVLALSLAPRHVPICWPYPYFYLFLPWETCHCHCQTTVVTVLAPN